MPLVMVSKSVAQKGPPDKWRLGLAQLRPDLNIICAEAKAALPGGLFICLAFHVYWGSEPLCFKCPASIFAAGAADHREIM